MELRQLRYFLAVAEHLSFSRAAEELYISQPSLSYQIAELEKELGTQLFQRDRRTVSLTAAGSALLEPARETLEASERLLRLARDGAPEEAGVLRVGFDDTEDHFELTGITEALASFADAHAGLQLEMSRMPFAECTDRLIYGDLDLAFLVLRYREKLPPELESRSVRSTRIAMVVREDCPAETCEEAVEQLDLILVGEKPRGSSRILRLLEDRKLRPRVRQVDSMPAGFTYVQMGRGILLLTEAYVQEHRYTGLKAIPIPGEEAEIVQAAVWNRNSAGPAARQFIAQLQAGPGGSCGLPL